MIKSNERQEKLQQKINKNKKLLNPTSVKLLFKTPPPRAIISCPILVFASISSLALLLLFVLLLLFILLKFLLNVMTSALNPLSARVPI